MKMSYRDRVILLVVIVVALVLCGIFLIVKPTTTKITQNKASLATAQAEVDRINGIIEQVPILGDTIESEYQESKTYAESFAEGRDTYEADQFIQEYLNNNNIEVTSFTVNQPGTETIDFYSYAPNVITYPLLEAADLNGDIAAATAEKLKTSTVFADLESQTVESYSVDIQFNGKKEDILALLDNVKDIDENVLVTNVSIADYTFNADGNDSSEKGYSTGSMNVTFYVLEPLAEPVLG
jgi:hypothetical protein